VTFLLEGSLDHLKINSFCRAWSTVAERLPETLARAASSLPCRIGYQAGCFRHYNKLGRPRGWLAQGREFPLGAKGIL